MLYAHVIRGRALFDPYLRHAHRAPLPNSRESESNITKRMCRWHDSITHCNAVLRFLRRKTLRSLPATTKLQYSPILANHESCTAVTISSSSDSVPTRHNLSLLITSHARCDLYAFWSFTCNRAPRPRVNMSSELKCHREYCDFRNSTCKPVIKPFARCYFSKYSKYLIFLQGPSGRKFTLDLERIGLI